MGCAWLLKEVLRRSGHRIRHYEHLCRKEWSKRGCGYKYCRACDDWNEEKETIVQNVLTMWNSLTF